MTASTPKSQHRRIAIVGVGLLGGSVAKAVRRDDPTVHIVGVSRTKETRDTALKMGTVDEAHDSIEVGCHDCDVVVVATPVDRIARHVVEAAATTRDHCLITDVGSTKAGIVRAVAEDAIAAEKFVAAHPIAGSEKTGVANARANLFDDKLIIVTPAESTSDERQKQAKSFWALTGGRCITMSPDQHDTRLAAVSHVPHLMSALVATSTPEVAIPLAGSGWRDITRVAAGDPEMWTAICQQNRKAIIEQLEGCGAELSRLTRILRDGNDDVVMTWLSTAQAARQQAARQQTTRQQADDPST